MPAPIEARTPEGEIVVRVPRSAPTGAQAIVVAQEGGWAETGLRVRRYAGTVTADGISWSHIGDHPPRPVGVTRIAGASFLAISSDGRAGYVADEQGGLSVLDLAARGGPIVVGRSVSPSRPRALLAARTRPRLVVVQGSEVWVFDTSVSLRPHERLMGHIAPVLRSEAVDRWTLSPSGDVLAATDGDRIFVIPANHLRAGMLISPRALGLSPEGLRQIDELLFAPHSDSLWAMSTSTAYELRIRGAGSDSLSLELTRTLPRNESPWPAALPDLAQP